MVEKSLFGYTQDNQKVNLYRITNKNGNYVEVIDYGCRIRKIVIADKKGNPLNMCLGYDSVLDYEKDVCFIGAAVGRYGNRIAKGEFDLNGVTYHLTQNEKGNHLHGGETNFGNQIWNVENEDNKIVCKRRFMDGEEGYPGDMDVTITYSWNDENQLEISYEAVSTKDTIINLTNHAYFNLSGDSKKDILKHKLCILTDKLTVGDEKQIPTGEVMSVNGTPFDFRELHEIGERIYEDDKQLHIGKGYDHNYMFDDFSMKKMAILQCEESGIQMICSSNQPGIQLYTGNNLDDTTKNVSGFDRYVALCLETQNYPDAINHKNFPSPVLKANEVYQTKTIYEFSNM